MVNTATGALDSTAAMLPQQQPPPATTTAAYNNPNLTTNQPLIDCPHPIDVLLPVGGYQLWAGNRRYRMLVELRRPEFRAAASQQEQARIALDIVRTIQKEGGRFLAAIETPANSSNNATTASPGIVRTTVWRVLLETDVLTQLGAALRDEQGRARKRRRQQRRARRRERRRQRRAARQAAVESAAGGGGGGGGGWGSECGDCAKGANPEESLPAGNSALAESLLRAVVPAKQPRWCGARRRIHFVVHLLVVVRRGVAGRAPAAAQEKGPGRQTNCGCHGRGRGGHRRRPKEPSSQGQLSLQTQADQVAQGRPGAGRGSRTAQGGDGAAVGQVGT